MASISGLNLNNNYFGTLTSGVNTLFSSLSTSGTSSLASLVSDYSSIRTGSYGKLLRAYYSESDSDSTESTSSTSKTSTASSANESLATTRDIAKDLKSSADKLTEGITDSDDLLDAAKSFVSSYNKAVSNTGVTGQTNGKGMLSLTNVMSNSLSKVGISVGVDNKLTIDEDKFKSADSSKLNALFKGTNSYAGQVASYASQISTKASADIASNSGSTYNSYGSYISNNYAYSGSLYTSVF